MCCECNFYGELGYSFCLLPALTTSIVPVDECLIEWFGAQRFLSGHNSNECTCIVNSTQKDLFFENCLVAYIREGIEVLESLTSPTPYL